MPSNTNIVPCQKIMTEKIALAFANSSNPIIDDEVIYPVICTKIHGVRLNILIDSGSASSHITEKLVKAIKATPITRQNPLQIIGFGNTKSSLITEFAQINLVGIEKEEISIKFNIFKRDLITALPAVSSAVLDEFPHLLQHKDNLSAPIPRGPTEIDAIIGVKDLAKLYQTKDSPMDNCQDICLMRRADSVDSAIEAKRTIFGMILTGSISGTPPTTNLKERNEAENRNT